MEFDKLLETRRSVRAFDETKKVSESQIRQLVEAGYTSSIVEKFPNS